MRRILWTLLLAWFPAAAFAGTHRFELTPMVGYQWGGKLSSQDTTIFDEDVEAEDSQVYGVTFDIPLSSDFQIELLASRQPTEFRFDEELFGPSHRVADVDISYYHVGFLWQGGRGQVDPFFVVSVGGTTIDLQVPGATDETRFSASLGGGAKIFFSRNVGLRLEGRGFWTAIRDSDNDYWDRHYSNDNDFYQGMAAIGLIIAF